MNEDKKISFRNLKESEIEVRVAQAKAGGVQLLLYKTARTDMNILDETVGPENWQCRFYECKGNLFCSTGIRINGDWIWKDDAGAPSNMEAEKGEASDARKRSGICWGIGRELYTSPFIWINADKCNIKTGNNGKHQCFDRFFVEKIRITSDKEIAAVAIKNAATGKRCFVWQAVNDDV